jgi:hypothetical protein
MIKHVLNRSNILGVLPSDVALTDGGSNNCVGSFSTTTGWLFDGLACVTVTIGKWFLSNQVDKREEILRKNLLVLLDFNVFLFTVKDGLFYKREYMFIFSWFLK